MFSKSPNSKSLKKLDFPQPFGYNRSCQMKRGFGVVVTCNFPKVETTGSSPVTRFKKASIAKIEAFLFLT